MALKAGAEKLLDVLMNQAAKSLQAAIRPNLAKTGLRVEDLFTDKVEEFKEALSFVHPDVRVGRMRRTRRAIDLDFKHKNFDDYAPNVDQETFKFEIFDYMNRIRAREYEKSVLSKS